MRMKKNCLLSLLFLFAAGVQAATYAVPEGTNSLIGHMQFVIAAADDTLLSLGRRYGVGYEEIVAANPMLDVWLPGAGSTVVIPTRHLLPAAPREGIVINVPEQRLYYYPTANQAQLLKVYTYPVSVGAADWQTPLGTSRVVAKHVNPSWYPTPSVRREHAERGDVLPAVVGPGPDNPLGQYALRLDLGRGAYLIHGTNNPTAIGMPVTHGCIRMFPEDIEELFNLVALGTKVLIIDQPYKIGWSDDDLYVEVHATHAQLKTAQYDDLTKLTRALVAATKTRSATINWPATERLLVYGSIPAMPMPLIKNNGH